ncbi:MAG: nicotinate-nucleotide diphosphorylase (carboxylating) [Desulfovibrionaceae bacterium CG1_02_65_16]|nr:MAG: nicotinate-nucleotide diphosphorylase (carboxylating) [Desulfovibrionaceae bacterium CG1_02_65_16]
MSATASDSTTLFDTFFKAEAKLFLLAGIRIALSEDGKDMTSQGIFTDKDLAQAHIVAKDHAVIAGLPLIPLILEFAGCEFQHMLNVDEGDRVSPGTLVAAIQGPATHLLRTERVILNYLCHLSGVATLTAKYVEALKGTRTTLLDTRKTLPGLRYPEKYAVLVGGAKNHRLNLSQMLMIKDNHIDRAGGIKPAVDKLRAAYGTDCPPIEVECRSLDEVDQAVACRVHRVMFDNMSLEMLRAALARVPAGIETEASGGVNLETIAAIGAAGPDFVSVGRITHSAPVADLSMRISALA